MPSAFAKSLASARAAAGLTQVRLAKMLDVEAMTVSRWERGLSEPSRHVLPKLRDALPAVFVERKPRLNHYTRAGGGQVYFAQRDGDGPIKIGFTTKDPAVRVRQVASDAGDRSIVLLVAVVGSMSDESWLHERFDNDCVGHEWFVPSDDLVALVCSLASGGDLSAFISEWRARRDAEDEAAYEAERKADEAHDERLRTTRRAVLPMLRASDNKAAE